MIVKPLARKALAARLGAVSFKTTPTQSAYPAHHGDSSAELTHRAATNATVRGILFWNISAVFL
jgi:hypothetical protein